MILGGTYGAQVAGLIFSINTGLLWSLKTIDLYRLQRSRVFVEEDKSIRIGSVGASSNQFVLVNYFNASALIRPLSFNFISLRIQLRYTLHFQLRHPKHVFRREYKHSTIKLFDILPA